MPTGVPLTAEQVKTISEVYAKTGNACEAARAAGISEAAVRRLLKKQESARRAEIHARAVARGVRLARRTLVADLKGSTKYLETEGTLEPRDYAEVLKARAGTAKALMAMQQRVEDAAEAPLRRRKLRAETQVAEKRSDGSLPAEKHEVSAVARVVVLPALEDDAPGSALAPEPGPADGVPRE